MVTAAILAAIMGASGVICIVTLYALHRLTGGKMSLKNGCILILTFKEEKKMNEKRTKEAIITDIIQYFKENEDVFNDCMEELDSYNGYLGDDRYYDMEELNALYSGQEPQEILFRAFYGFDADTWTTDSSGNKEYGKFSPNRDYFYFNGYGNLVSSDYKDYSDKLDGYAIEEMSENRNYIDSIENDDILAGLFDELEEAEEE